MTRAAQVGLLLLAGLLAAACGPRGPHATSTSSVLERFECNRCHDTDVVEAATEERHCVRCHQSVLAGRLDDDYRSELVARWKRRIVDLRDVPALTGIDRRLRRDWVVAFLQQPNDVRPLLTATMPRLRIGPADAESIADALGMQHPDPDSTFVAFPGHAQRGRELFTSKGCAACHDFSGAVAPVERPPLPRGALSEADRARALAPDLRHARARMTTTAVEAWLEDPQAISPRTLMPRPELDLDERSDLVAFIFEAPLEPAASPLPPERLPLLDRPVRHAEVERRVFKRICWHCHSDPAPVHGDGGPGNTGGFGFAGKGLDFGSYDAVLRGTSDGAGGRRSVLEPMADGTPRIVAHLLARHEEATGRPGDLLGMPLGLPPLPLEEIQLVESWVAQGSPR